MTEVELPFKEIHASLQQTSLEVTPAEQSGRTYLLRFALFLPELFAQLVLLKQWESNSLIYSGCCVTYKQLDS